MLENPSFLENSVIFRVKFFYFGGDVTIGETSTEGRSRIFRIITSAKSLSRRIACKTLASIRSASKAHAFSIMRVVRVADKTWLIFA